MTNSRGSPAVGFILSSLIGVGAVLCAGYMKSAEKSRLANIRACEFSKANSISNGCYVGITSNDGMLFTDYPPRVLPYWYRGKYYRNN
jgi:hypothetical protein